MSYQSTPGTFQPGSPEAISSNFALRRYLHYWYLFVLGLALAVAGTILYLRYTTPLYSISSSVLIKDKRDQTVMPRNERFDYTNEESLAKNLDNEIILLKSVSLMQRVLTELGLNTTYSVRGKVREQEVLQSELPFQLVVSQLDSTAFKKKLTITPEAGGRFRLEEDGQPQATYSAGQSVQRTYGTYSKRGGL
jgi:tyrosine-protein kinase Etk/Wzc